MIEPVAYKIENGVPMDLAKANWRLSSPRRKLKAIRKMRPGRDVRKVKFDLLEIAASDPNWTVRVAAARKLCSLGSIASFIEDDLMGPLKYHSHQTDGPKFQLVHDLLEVMEEDADALFDIAMNVDLYVSMHEDQPPPTGAAAREEESTKWRECAVRNMHPPVYISPRADALLYRIAAEWETLPDVVADAARDQINDPDLLCRIYNDRKMQADFAMREAQRLRDTDFLASVAYATCPANQTGHRWVYNGIRDGETGYGEEVQEEEYICAICGAKQRGWVFHPHPFRPERNVSASEDAALASLLERETDEYVIRKSIAKIADIEALLAIAHTNPNETTRKEAVFEAYDRDRGILRRIDDEILLYWLGMYTFNLADLEYISPKMTQRYRQRNIRRKKIPAWRIPKHHQHTALGSGSAVRVAAVDAVSGDENLARLLEHESDRYAVRKIIAKIADVETLFGIATNADANIETRAEAVIAAYEKDKGILGRIRDEELLCILGMHVTDARDMLFIINAIENQECLYAIGSRMLERENCDTMNIYLAALAKVADQTRLTVFFTNSAGHRGIEYLFRPFFVALLNMINDPRSLGFIWLITPPEWSYSSFDFNTMAGVKILNPAAVWTEASRPEYPEFEAVIGALADDHVFLEKLVEHWTEHYLAYATPLTLEQFHSKVQFLHGKLDPTSSFARGLLEKVQALKSKLLIKTG